MGKLFCVMVFTFISLKINASQGNLERYVQLMNNKPKFHHTNIGVAVHDVQSQSLLFGYNQGKTFIPASSIKLLTSLIALDELGNDFKYETFLATDGDVLRDGTLTGNLYIIGSGDPSLGSDRFKDRGGIPGLMNEIVQAVKTKGINCIDGEVIVDESVYDAFPVAPSWQWNDLGNYYAGGTWGMNIGENEYKIYFNSNQAIGRRARMLFMEPKVPGLRLYNEVTVDKEDTPDNAYIFGGPYTYDKRIVGTIPFDKSPFRIKGSLPDPPRFMAYTVEKALNASKIITHGYTVQIRDKKNDKKRVNFHTISSPPLIDLVRATNYHSINLYCESFLKTIGQKFWKESSGSAGIAYIKKYLLKNKIDDGSLFMHDGSGLSARNLLSPELLSQFLASFGNRKNMDLLQDLLPKAGAEGTVQGMLHGYGSQSRVWMKSGSMDQVLSLTGICKAQSGKWVTFCIILNGFGDKHKDIRPDTDKLIEQIYRAF